MKEREEGKDKYKKKEEKMTRQVCRFCREKKVGILDDKKINNVDVQSAAMWYVGYILGDP